MLENLNAKIQKTPINKLIIYLTSLSLLSDITLLIYIRDIVLERFLNQKLIVSLLSTRGLSFGQYEMQGFEDIITNTMSSIIIFILAYNIFFYLMCIKKKPWALKYLSFYTISTVALSVLEMSTSIFNSSVPFSLTTLLTSLTYGFIYYSLKLRKEELKLK